MSEEQRKAKHDAHRALGRLQDALRKSREVERLAAAMDEADTQDHYAELIERALTARRHR